MKAPGSVTSEGTEIALIRPGRIRWFGSRHCQAHSWICLFDASRIASSQLISSNSPEPFSPTSLSGLVKRASLLHIFNARKALAAGRALVDFPALHLHQLAVAHVALQQVVLALGRTAAVDQLAVGERVLPCRRLLLGRLLFRLGRAARKPHGSGRARRCGGGHERPARQRRHRPACRLLHRALLSSPCHLRQERSASSPGRRKRQAGLLRPPAGSAHFVKHTCHP